MGRFENNSPLLLLTHLHGGGRGATYIETSSKRTDGADLRPLLFTRRLGSYYHSGYPINCIVAFLQDYLHALLGWIT